MIVVSYFNEGKPSFALAEKEDINMIIGLILKNYIGKSVPAEMFDNKKLSVVDGTLVAKEMLIKHEINENAIKVFKDTTNSYNKEEAYLFDDYCCYTYTDGVITEINEKSYSLVTCPVCGKTNFEKDTVFGHCLECFLDKGIDDMLEESKSVGEEYTEFEKMSQVCATVTNFKEKLKPVLNGTVRERANTVIKEYIRKEKVEEIYVNRILGGAVA